ncbi:hypothetical protein [Alkalilacustris brevis]|uniref:hypothetical protein n=1 Tax=Alkalilacustris brevis TaxID=2026338 RepID=UPI000E0CD088|nr:hypothetical protein [Alkalilacustris brevis]
MTELVQKLNATRDRHYQLESSSNAKPTSQEPVGEISLNEMISNHYELEARSSQLREELEHMMRKIQRREVANNAPVNVNDRNRIARPVSVPNFETFSALDAACGALGYNRSALDWTKSRRKEFIYGADAGDLGKLQALESEFRQLESKSESLVQEILSVVPGTNEQALDKLKWMVSIMLNSECVEVDYFACLVGECVQAIETSPECSMKLA